VKKFIGKSTTQRQTFASILLSEVHFHFCAACRHYQLLLSVLFRFFFYENLFLRGFGKLFIGVKEGAGGSALDEREDIVQV
jgi:hypothetical protein